MSNWLQAKPAPLPSLAGAGSKGAVASIMRRWINELPPRIPCTEVTK